MINDRYMELQSKMAQTAQLCHRGTCLALDELHGADGTQEEDGRKPPRHGLPATCTGWVLH